MTSSGGRIWLQPPAWSANSSAAIAFQDAKAAADILAALKEKRWNEKAHLYDTGGRLFASFHAEEAAVEQDHESPGELPPPC